MKWQEGAAAATSRTGAAWAAAAMVGGVGGGLGVVIC